MCDHCRKECVCTALPPSKYPGLRDEQNLEHSGLLLLCCMCDKPIKLSCYWKITVSVFISYFIEE